MLLRSLLAWSIPIVFAAAPAAGQSKEAAFRSTLQSVVQKIAARDSAGLSKYIDKNTGVYLLHRIGIQDVYDHYNTIGFSDSSYPYILYFKNVKLTPLKYARLPQNDHEKWSGFGTFVDTVLRDQLLTKTALSMKQDSNKPISQAELNKLTVLESISRKVMVVNNNRNYLILSLTYINNKWMLTIIDALTGDWSI